MGLADVPVPTLLNKHWIRDNDWLASRLDKWISRCQGYNKLKNCNHSLSEDEEDKGNWDGASSGNSMHKQHSLKEEENCEIGNLNIPPRNKNKCRIPEKANDSPERHSVDTQTPTEPKTMCCQNIKCEMTVDNYANYNQNLEVNDNYEASHPVSHTEIRIAVNNKVISSVELDYQNEQNGNSDNVTCATNKQPSEGCTCDYCSGDSPDDNRGSLDKHRKLIQIMATPIRKLGKHMATEERNRKEFQHPISEVAAWRQASNELRSFLSFRCRNTSTNSSKNSKTNRRKRHIVVGGVGANDPVWPSVLLTFERGVSNRPDSPHALMACQERYMGGSLNYCYSPRRY